MKTIIKLLTLVFLLASCHKNCPKPGNYQMTFTGTYEDNGSESIEIGNTIIKETTKDSFFIGYSEVKKHEKKITGEIGGPGSLAWAKITGTCKKKSGKYYLSGTFTGATYNARIINGEFEIKSI